MDWRKGFWRLNEDLIEDEEVGRIIKTEIEQYFKINYTPDVSKATIWEAHKAYTRGKIDLHWSWGKKRKRIKYEKHNNGITGVGAKS